MTWPKMLGVALAGLTVAVPLAAADAPAAGNQGHHHNTILHFGVSFGARAHGSLTVDGESTNWEERSAVAFNMLASIDQRVIEWLSLGAMARLGTWDSGWSERAGQHRRYVDANLVPKLRGDGRAPGHDQVYLALPVGLTWISVTDTAPHRAVTEQWRPNLGWNLGAAIGYELFGKHFGGYLELGNRVQFASFDVTFTPVDEPNSAVHQRFSYVDHQVLLSAGGLFGF